MKRDSWHYRASHCPNVVINPDFSLSVFIRMLYSCLVDADFLDTEQFMTNGKAGRDSGESLEILDQRLSEYIKGWLENKDLTTVNGHRSEILRSCIQSGEEEPGMFQLTVPTGGREDVGFPCVCLETCSPIWDGTNYLRHSIYEYY